MNATKTSFQVINNEFVEWQANGAIPTLIWEDESGNNWRAMASYQFDSVGEVYTIIVNKYLKLASSLDWILVSTYPITADYTKYRRLATGELINDITGIPPAINELGLIVDTMGWVYNSKYFTIGIGYNPMGAIVSINYWIYLEIAEKEGLIII